MLMPVQINQKLIKKCLRRLYLKKELMELTDFMHAGTISHKLKEIENFWGDHAQKLVWPVWSWDSKMNRWNKVTFPWPHEFKKAKN